MNKPKHVEEVFLKINTLAALDCYCTIVESNWNVMAHGDAREGKWRGKWRMVWVAVLFTLPRKMVYTSLLPLMRTPRLPVVDWTDAPADLNGLARCAERRNLVSARVPSHFNTVHCCSFFPYKNVYQFTYSEQQAQTHAPVGFSTEIMT